MSEIDLTYTVWISVFYRSMHRQCFWQSRRSKVSGIQFSSPVLHRCLFQIHVLECFGPCRWSKSEWKSLDALLDWISSFFRSIVDNDLHTSVDRKWVKFTYLSPRENRCLFWMHGRQCFVRSGSWKEGWVRRCRRQNLVLAHLRRKLHPRRIFGSRVICYKLLCRVRE